MDVSDRRLQVQLTQKAKIATGFPLDSTLFNGQGNKRPVVE